MRIAHILWSLGTGGAENMVVDITTEQVKSNDVALFVINDWVDDYLYSKIDKHVRVFLLHRKAGGRSILPILKLNLLLAKFRPDIIHTHSFQLINLILYPFGKRVRTIHNTHNDPVEYPRFDKLISISKTVKDFTTRQGFDSVEIDNGIVAKKICYKPMKAFTDGKHHFVQVSRLAIEQKGQDILLHALSVLVERYNFEDFVLHLIGDGEDRAVLENMVDDLHLQGKVIFEGQKPQPWIYQNLCNYDLFIQPSRYEGFGLTVAEAMAAKVPVLVSNIEGPMEIIGDGKFGMSFVSEDADDCARQIKMFCDAPNLKVREEAYQHVIAKYDVSVTARKYLEVYTQLMDNERK